MGIYFAIFLFLLRHGMIQCANILLVPVDIPSQISIKIHVGNALVTKGHQVTLVLPDKYPIKDPAQLSNLNVMRYKTDHELHLLGDYYPQEAVRLSLEGSAFEIFNYTFSELDQLFLTCESVVKDQDFISTLSKYKFDFALVDIVSCMAYLPYKLNVSYALMGVNCYEPRLPTVYSYVPSPELLAVTTDNMNFKTRLVNFLLYWVAELFYSLDLDDSVSRKYISEKKPITRTEAAIESTACFIVREPVTDFARQLPTHHIYVGQILGRPAKPIVDREIKQFIEEANDGIIVVTFGTFMDKIPLYVMETVLVAFRAISQKVIMRYSGDDKIDVPENVKLLPWIPQNDLLGHPKTRLAIFHGGANTLNEVAYHGVPSIVVPMLLDQVSNAGIVKSRKYGKVLSIRELTSNELVDTIKEVLQDIEIKKNVIKLKQILQDKENSGLSKLDYWIKYLIKYGGDFIKSETQYSMPWYSYYSEDVRLFIFGIIAILVYVEYKLFRLICRCCCKSNKQKKD